MSVDRRPWTKQAKCIGTDPERYASATLTPAHRTRDARKLCAGCPVLRECALDAIESHATDVVRAGVALPPYNAGNLNHYYRRLRTIAESGPPEVQPGVNELEKIWLKARCQYCHRLMRPRSTTGTLAAKLWPQRVTAANRTTCNSCWKELRKSA